MTTDELIRALWELALNVNTELLNAAADRLEELDERIAIMAADMDNGWGNGY